jgi:hypothetical protein
MPILAIFIGAWLRIRFFLHLRRKPFFIVYMRVPPDNLESYTVLNSEVEHETGKIPVIKIKGGRYHLISDYFFRSGIDPAIEFKMGNPNPIMRFPRNQKDIDNSGFTAEELRDAFDTKMFQDLLRYNFTNLDYMLMILLCVSIMLNVIILFLLFDASNALTAISKDLNKLIPTSSSTGSSSIIGYFLSLIRS